MSKNIQNNRFLSSNFPITGDRVQIINTLGSDNGKFGIVEKHGEVRLNNGDIVNIPDWEYQLRKVSTWKTKC